MNSEYDNTQIYITTEELAQRYGLASETVKRWRYKGYGPPYHKARQFARSPKASRIRYKMTDVIEWERLNGIFPVK